MKIFFAGSTARLSQKRAAYERIIKHLKKRGHSVMDSWVVETMKNPKNARPAKEILLQQLKFIQNADIMVVEADTPSFGIGFLMAHALSEHKPILCLYPEDAEIELLSDIIKGSTSSLITLRRYRQNNISSVLDYYFANLKPGSLQKFNFLASPEVLEFISKGAQEEGKTKSEFLRDKIAKELIDKKE